jgi:hypothetical protein
MGHLDLVRASSGGLVRAIRSTPFAPTPTTLYVQWTMSVEEITAADNNAVYFYIGREFRTDNSSIVPNDNLFARFSLNFQSDNTYVIRDLQTNTNSMSISTKTPISITWVLNNSIEGHVYKMPETATTPDYKVMPSKYDLWINGTLFVSNVSAYPGSNIKYHPDQLTNFEVKFWTGLGRVRFYNFKIRDIAGILPTDIALEENKVETKSSYIQLLTNPTTSGTIFLKYEDIKLHQVALYTLLGEEIQVKPVYKNDYILQLSTPYQLSAGMYMVCYLYDSEKKCEKLLLY